MFTSKNPVLQSPSNNVHETQLINLKYDINILLNLNLKISPIIVILYEFIFLTFTQKEV